MKSTCRMTGISSGDDIIAIVDILITRPFDSLSRSLYRIQKCFHNEKSRLTFCDTSDELFD